MDDNPQAIKIMEPNGEWRRKDVESNTDWIEQLTLNDQRELETALQHAKSVSSDLLQITREDFPLDHLAIKLKSIENELINGHGFKLIRGLDRDKYNNDDMCMLYWGIGLHLGNPWPQNKYGHMLGDVTDQGKAPDDPTSRGNEIGGVALPYHSDGSDLVGLMCLQRPKTGGQSAVSNALAVHNEMVRTRPDLVAELYKPQPNDFRGEQASGKNPWYEIPVFSVMDDRLYTRYIRPYILASQRHEGAPRITKLAEEAMQLMDKLTNSPQFNIFMDLQPGDIQIINNYHTLHARAAYEDDKENGQVRHLKRLWLETRVLKDRPQWFQASPGTHWGKKKVISRLDATH